VTDDDGNTVPVSHMCGYDMHLTWLVGATQVGALASAEAFYNGVLDLTHRYPGAIFYSADHYHHHIATNIWNSHNAPPRSFPSTGLSEMEILLDAARAEAVLTCATGTVHDTERPVLTDPWGTPIALTVSP